VSANQALIKLRGIFEDFNHGGWLEDFYGVRKNLPDEIVTLLISFVILSIQNVRGCAIVSDRMNRALSLAPLPGHLLSRAQNQASSQVKAPPSHPTPHSMKR